MKNFTNNFKQFTSRLSARWLIMALMLLVGTSSAWGWTIYYDNSGTPSWTDVYVVIGHDTWWRSYQMTKNNNVFQYTDTGWDDATFIAFSNSHKNSNGGNNTDWNSISNIRFGYGVSHVDKHVFTTNNSKLVDITHVNDVLNGDVIGFYVGEYTSWNQQQFYVKNSSITIPTCLSFESGSSRYGVVYASSFDYTISHGDGTWGGPTLGEKAVLGTAYLVKNNNEVSKNAGTLPSCTFSIDNTIKAGETSTKSVTSSGKSKYGTQDYSEDSYYVKKSGETSLTKLEVVDSELQTQSLAVGEYTIYVLLFDGRIYAKGGEQTLTVETACDKPSEPSITINHVSICSRESAIIEAGQIDDAILYSLYKGNNDAPAQTNNTGIFEVSEAASYRVTVTTTCGESRKSSFVTLSKKTGPTASNYVIKDASKSKEYMGSEQTLTAEDITVNNAGPVASVYFKQDGNIVDPINVGDYEVYVTTAATEDICAGDVMIGTFTITCPAPEAPTFEVTQHEVKCGTESLQKGIIKITNPVDGYKYRLVDEGNTEYELDSNNSITGIDAGKYRVSAVRYCGDNKSSTTNTAEYAEVNSTDVKLTPTLSSTPIVKCKDNYAPGTLVITNYNADYNYTFNPSVSVAPIIEGTNATYSIEGTVATEYTVTATHKTYNTCSSPATTTVGLTDNTPAATVSITGENSICNGQSTTLTCNVSTTNNVQSYQWNLNGTPIQGATESTYNARETGKYTVVVTVSNDGCTDGFTNRTPFSLTVNSLPAAPSLISPDPVCEGTTVNLPTGYNWYDAETDGNKVADTAIEATGTYWAAAVQKECESATRTRYDVTVNPKPSIGSITQNVALPVPFEDVELTATGVTQGAEVKWYLGDNVTPVATGTTYVVTSENEGEVTVKAKAFLGDCESDFKEHKVTFDEENCQGNLSNDIIINFTHPDKDETNKNCQYWGFGKLDYKINGTSQSIDLGKETAETKTITIENIVASKITDVKFTAHYKFNSCDCEAYTTTIELEKGYEYDVTIEDGDGSGQQSSGAAEKTLVIERSVSLSTQPPLSAPAVKMISAEYDEENDVIVAKGAVYKTGCGTTFWGFQYSRNGQTWGTADADFIHPSGNSLSVPGEFEYSFAIPKAGGGDIYYIRAYALNNYNGSYALSNAVYSTTSLPVEIPSKTIEFATIALVEPSTDTEVCPQSTVYLKVSYEGGDFTDFVAEEDFPGTDLELVNHDKANNYAIFSFTATAAGTANITISNKSGSTVTPADGVSITLKDVQVATPPTIYLEKNTICDNQTTNVVVNSPIIGFIYSLKNGSVGDPITCESEDLKFEVSKEGSYTVQVQETVCGTTAISAPVDLRVITSDVKITLTTDVNTITPWQPLTLTVKAPSGYDYDLQGLDGTVYTKNGDVYTIKFRRPKSWGVGNSKSDSEPKTFTAGIKAGEEPSCSTTTKEIQLVDTEEVCLAPGN